MSTVRRAVKLAIGEVRTNTRIGLACSGGADSIALVDAALSVTRDVVVLHIDHGLSPGSATVAEEVVTWARGQGVEAYVRRVQVDSDASLEAAAREARYEAFEALASELELSAILLAHTARDQAETVLMRILRGTGPAGLAGIAATRDIYVRPLLEVSRATIDEYVSERGLPTWTDPMNADLAFMRVRVRDQLLPLLRSENPSLDEALCRLADSSREWLAVIDSLATPFAQLPIDCPTLATQLAAVRKRAIAIALEQAGLGFDAVHLDAIDELVIAPTAGERTLDLPGGQLVRSYDELRRPLPHAIEELRAPAGPYELRPWRPGDRMKPPRLKGRSRKLSDLFIDLKVPRELREHARVVIRTADGTIVWAEHVGLAFDEPEASAPVRMTRSF